MLLYERDGRDALRVVLHCSLLVAGGGPRSTLHGVQGSWVKFGADTQERQLVAGMLPDDPLYGIDPDAGILIDGATGSRTEVPSPRGCQQLYYLGIRDAIWRKQPPLITARDAVAVMAVLETSIESGTRGRVLPLPLTAEETAQWD